MTNLKELVAAVAVCLSFGLPSDISPVKKQLADRDTEALHQEMASSFKGLGRHLEDIADDPGNHDKGSITVEQEPTNFHFDSLIPGDSSILVSRYRRAFMIVEGVPERCDGVLTKDHSFLFSDCLIHVQKVIKEDPAVDLTAGQNVIVCRLGGSLTVHGKEITAIDKGFPAFTYGDRYIFYLGNPTDRLGAFIVGPNSTFKISDGMVVPSRMHEPWGSFPENDFLQVNREARLHLNEAK